MVMVALAKTPIPELRAWLTTAEEMLTAMSSDDPRFARDFETWNSRHETYMARARVEGEPE